MIDEEIEKIFARSVDVQKTADRLYQLTGRRFIVEEIGKNDPEYTQGAYDDPDKGDAGGDYDELDDGETELSPREQTRRRRQLAENAAERGRIEATKLLKGVTMIDSDTLIEQVTKAGLGFAVVKRFAEKADSDELTEAQCTALLMGAWGREFGKRFQAQDEEGRIARAAVMRARDAAWLAPTVATGERALATTTPARGEKADPLRERIIRDKAVGSPFLSQEQLAAYADAMVAELERLVRGKQERGRPGTLQRI
jgi:hypothetical protein